MMKCCWRFLAISVLGALTVLWLVATLVYFDSSSRAQTASYYWTADGVIVTQANGVQISAQAASDGWGGAIITWLDTRNGNSDVYAQHISSTGEALWKVDGVVICDDESEQANPRIVPDGFDGAVITWQDNRGTSTDIYAQRIDWYGNVRWTTNGIAVCTADYEQLNPILAPDGSGGAIITWEDNRSSDLDIYAQRIDSIGTGLWTGGGVTVSSVTGAQSLPRIVAVGSAAVVIAWQLDVSGEKDIYAQKLDGDGTKIWSPTSGLAIATASGNQVQHRLTEDGAGGAIITWTSDQSTSKDIYAHHVESSGSLDSSWPTGGRLVCGESGDQEEPEIVNDGQGGAIIAWQDGRGSSKDVYAQRVDVDGVLQWTPSGGLALCTAVGDQINPAVAGNGSAGLIVAWRDERSGTADIYTQFVGADGSVERDTDGVAVCTAVGEQSDVQLVANNVGSALYAWTDSRGVVEDIYAHRMGPFNLYGYVNVSYFYTPSNEYVSFGLEGVKVIAIESGSFDTVSTVTESQMGTPDVWGYYELELIDGWSGTVKIESVPYPFWNGREPDEYVLGTLYGDYNADFIVNHEATTTWVPDGLPVVLNTPFASEPRIITDATGGAIVAWTDQRNDAADIYVQRIYRDGDTYWDPDGVALCVAPGQQYNARIASNGYEGIVACWTNLDGGNFDVYAGGINGWGDVTSPIGGIPVATGPNLQCLPAITTDAAGSPTIVWQELNTGWDIFATVQGYDDSVLVCDASGDQSMPEIAPNAPGEIAKGTYIVWQDHRGTDFDIYVQRIDYWTNGLDPTWNSGGRAVCQASNNQSSPRVIYDDAQDAAGRGAMVFWLDQRTDANFDIYAQRITAADSILWTTDGVAVCAATGYQSAPVAVCDGMGGFIVAWEDGRNSGTTGKDIYAQRIHANGTFGWQTDGIVVCNATGDQTAPRIARDGRGSFIISWVDARGGVQTDIYAQRVLLSGSVDWSVNGEPIVSADGLQNDVQIAADANSKSGTYFVWKDSRASAWHIYADRIEAPASISGRVTTADGIGIEGVGVEASEWGSNSLEVTTSTVTDPWGYYVLVLEQYWEGIVTLTPTDQYGRIEPDEPAYYHLTDEDIDGWDYVGYHEWNEWLDEWTGNGVIISDAELEQTAPQACTDGAGGAIIVWEHDNGNSLDIYARRVNDSGNPLWQEDGIVVCGAGGDQSEPQIVPDGSGGAIVVWGDGRGSSKDICAQRLDGSGNILWTGGNGMGIFVCSADGDQYSPVLVSDDDGGAYAVWIDERDTGTTGKDLYAQSISGSGQLRWSPSDGVLVSDATNDQIAPSACLDGAGNLIIVWEDYQSATYDPDIYGQKFDTEGDALWNGGQPKCICDTSGATPSSWLQLNPRVISDGTNYCSYVVWFDTRDRLSNDDFYHVYANRLNADGDPAIPIPGHEQGKLVLQNVVDEQGLVVVSDETPLYTSVFGCIVAAVSTSEYMLIHRFDEFLFPRWPYGNPSTNGIPVNDAVNAESYTPRLVSNETHGAVVVWSDDRYGHADLFAQEVDSLGNFLWKENGISVVQTYGDQVMPTAIIDGSGGAIVAWEDDRNGEKDIYAQRINEDGHYIDASVAYDIPSFRPFFVGCPAGDGDEFDAVIQFYEHNLLFDEILNTDIILDIVSGNVEFHNDGPVTANSNVNAANDFKTTMDHTAISGCGSVGIAVYDALLTGQTIRVKSYDLDASDTVDTDDTDIIMQTFDLCYDSTGYNDCADFSGDGCVNLTDFSMYGSHFGHYVSSPPGMLAGQRFISEATVKFSADSERNRHTTDRFFVNVSMESVNEMSLVCFGIDNSFERLTFAGFTPSDAFDGRVLLVPSTSRGRKILFGTAYATGGPVSRSIVELGTIEFCQQDVGAARDIDLRLVLGEIKTADGRKMGLTGVDYDRDDSMPLRNHLAQNYPNPFNPVTTIEYAISSPGHVDLAIYNVMGQLIRRLVDERQEARGYRIQWDGTNNNGKRVASGVYFYRLETARYRKTKKMILLR